MLYRKFHAKSGPFLETKLNKVMFFCLFSMFLSLSTGGYGTEVTAAEKQIVPCDVCLEIDSDSAVGPLVLYGWFFRKKYTFGYSIPINLTG